MDFDFGIMRAPKKAKKTPKAKKNLAGRRRGIIVESPVIGGNNNPYGMDDIYQNDSPIRDDPNNNNHRDDGGTDSNGSRFSTECNSDHYENERMEEEKKRSKGRRQEEKRQREKDKLAELQQTGGLRRLEEPIRRGETIRRGEPIRRGETIRRGESIRREEPECISIDDDDSGYPTFEPPSEAPSTFDGVPIDKVNNSAQKESLNKVVQQLVGNDDNDDAGMAKGRGKKKSRAKHHPSRSAMAKSLSPATRNRGQRLLSHDRQHQGSSREQNSSYDGRQERGLDSLPGRDPLDEAQDMQESNRGTSSSGRRNARNNGKLVENAEHSPLFAAKNKRGKSGSVGEKMGNMMDKLTAGGQANSKKQYGKADMSSNRQRRKNTQQKIDQPVGWQQNRRTRSDGYDSAESGMGKQTSSGEKRKHMGGYWPSNKQPSPKGSHDNVIDVDESMTVADIQHDDDVHSVDSSPSSTADKRNDDGGNDLLAAIKGCSTPVNQEDYVRSDATPKSDRKSSLWEDGTTKGTLNGTSEFGPKSNPRSHVSSQTKAANKKEVNNIHSHLQKNKKKDSLVDASSPISNDSLRDRETGSSTNKPRISGRADGKNAKKQRRSARSLSRMTMQDEESTPNKKNNDWMTTQRSSNASHNNRNQSIRKKTSFNGKLKKQGGRWGEEEKCSEFDFHNGSTPPSSSSEHKSKQPRRKNHRQSKIFMPPTGSLRQTRSNSRNRSKSGGSNNITDIITIDSSSEEDEDSIGVPGEDEGSINVPDFAEESVAESRGRRKRAAGDRASIDAVRIAVGKKVFKRKCELSFQFGTSSPYILFSYYDDKSNKNEHSVYLKDQELQEVKYFIASEDENEDIDESMTVMVFRITPTEKNNFLKYPRSYDQEDTEDAEKNEKRYISVEVRDVDDFQAMLLQMRQHEDLEIWCSEDSKIPPDELTKYTRALQEDSQKELKTRLGSAMKTRSGGNKTKKNGPNELLLVYPFDVDEEILAEAASGLKELGGDPLGIDLLDEDMYDRSTVGGDSSDDKGNASSSRTHYVSIRQDDKDRLCPGQFLNDSLVDFWMRWISRGEPQGKDSDVHFFTSHFMTTLKKDGPKAVHSWTAKKNIDVFNKKFIFVPVNADLHWSLCVIVNPGLIANTFENALVPMTAEHSCILFLDSLKMHSKHNYAKHIRKWLNFQWKRLGKGKVHGVAPFRDDTMMLKSPKIPYQENGCDCGVFVCRYAYNLYKMKHLKFTWDDIAEDKPLRTLITCNPAFEFDMADIARIRGEIETLIDNLSKLYLRMKEQEKAKKRAKRQAIESSKTSDKNASSSNSSTENAGEEVANAASRNEDFRSETKLAASEENGGIAGSIGGATVVTKDEDGDVIMSLSEEKENILQQEVVVQEKSTSEIVAPEKLASKMENTISDIPEEGENKNQGWSLQI